MYQVDHVNVVCKRLLLFEVDLVQLGDAPRLSTARGERESLVPRASRRSFLKLSEHKRYPVLGVPPSTPGFNNFNML